MVIFDEPEHPTKAWCSKKSGYGLDCGIPATELAVLIWRPWFLLLWSDVQPIWVTQKISWWRAQHKLRQLEGSRNLVISVSKRGDDNLGWNAKMDGSEPIRISCISNAWDDINISQPKNQKYLMWKVTESGLYQKNVHSAWGDNRKHMWLLPTK